MNNKKVVFMCGKGKGCCPVITLTKDEVLIKDDFGGKVKLTKEQFDFFKEKVKKDEL